MKVSAIGLLSSVAELLPKRATTENQADMYRHCLREMIGHIEMVQSGEETIQEFADHYCIMPENDKKGGAS